jgi:hypothetical protein
MVVLERRKRQHCGDVTGLQIWVVLENLVVRCPSGQKVEYIFHADAKAPDAGASAAHGRVDGHPVNCSHAPSGGASSAERLF